MIGIAEQVTYLSSKHKDDSDYEKALFEYITTVLQKEQLKIIVFIDNFGDMFNKFSTYEAHRLRKILQTSADIRIIAASSVVLEAFYDYKHPFYEFFKVKMLEGLDKADTNRLLLSLGKIYKREEVEEIIKNQSGRVEALRRLTGGVIRTIVLLFEIFIDDKNGTCLLYTSPSPRDS